LDINRGLLKSAIIQIDKKF